MKCDAENGIFFELHEVANHSPRKTISKNKLTISIFGTVHLKFQFCSNDFDLFTPGIN